MSSHSSQYSPPCPGAARILHSYRMHVASQQLRTLQTSQPPSPSPLPHSPPYATLALTGQLESSSPPIPSPEAPSLPPRSCSQPPPPKPDPLCIPPNPTTVTAISPASPDPTHVSQPYTCAPSLTASESLSPRRPRATSTLPSPKRNDGEAATSSRLARSSGRILVSPLSRGGSGAGPGSYGSHVVDSSTCSSSDTG